MNTLVVDHSDEHEKSSINKFVSFFNMSFENGFIRIAGMVEDSVVDGDGVRFTIFTQGCPHRCEGCHNPQTHSYDKGSNVPIDELKKDILANIPIIKGITLSGGEPFVQPKPCLELVKFAHDNSLDVWAYTGFKFEEIAQSGDLDRTELLYNVDYLVDGRYVKDFRDLSLRFRGSSNQRIINIKETLKLGTVVPIY